MLVAVGVTVPFVEMVGGWLLLAGLFRRPTAIALGLVLMMVNYGHRLKEPLLVTTQHIFPRTLLMIPTWILGIEDVVWSLLRPERPPHFQVTSGDHAGRVFDHQRGNVIADRTAFGEVIHRLQ